VYLSLYFFQSVCTQRILPVEGVWNIWENDFSFIKPIKVEKWRILHIEQQAATARGPQARETDFM
jgi:hypothetical protein